MPKLLLAIALATAVLASCLPAAGRARPAATAQATARPSPGCGAPRPPAPPQVTVGGVAREVLARLPAGYLGDEPRALVVAFHGRTNDSVEVRDYFDLDEAMPDALILYPQALPAGAGFTWSDPGDPPDRLRDFALFDALLELYSKSYCLDLERVFVVGHSLGAYFANDLACNRPTAVRAVASVAGGLSVPTCSPGAAAMLVHHPDDGLVPFSLGLAARDSFLAANRLPVQGVAAAEPALQRLRCRWHARQAEARVLWCPHGDATGPGGRHYPHTWPDGAAAAIATFLTGL